MEKVIKKRPYHDKGFQKGNQLWKLATYKGKIGEDNPSKRPEVRKKISLALRGRKAPWTTERNLKNNPSKRGELSHHWIKDRSIVLRERRKDERGDNAYREWRRQVWLRDNFKCKIANSECEGRIEAHHILGWTEHPSLRYEVNNGITLCHFHHPRVKTEVIRLVPFYQSLIPLN